MKKSMTALKVFFLAAGMTLPLLPPAADAQVVAPVVQCPAGYGYSSGYGCVPVSSGYGAVYGPPAVVEQPPVYDTFGIAFGFGGDGHHDGHHGGYHGGGHDDGHGGGDHFHH